MVEKEHDFRGAGAVDGCNALSDALVELGLLSGSGVGEVLLRLRFFRRPLRAEPG